MKTLRNISIIVILSLVSYACGEDTPIDQNIIDSTRLKFNEPSSIALVSMDNPSNKKQASLEETKKLFAIYEMASETFQPVTSQDGSEVFFSGVDEILDVNGEWKILVDYTRTREPDMEILLDDTGINPGEPVQTLLLNTSTGEIYDMEAYIRMTEIQADWNIGDPIDYSPESNSVYFISTENELCRIDLNTVALEKFTLPYAIGDYSVWREVNDMVFFMTEEQEPQFLVYKPNEGIINRSNLDVSPGKLEFFMTEDSSGAYLSSSLRLFSESDVPAEYLNPSNINEETLVRMKIDTRNDSIIYTPDYLEPDSRLAPQRGLQYGLYWFGKPIKNEGTRWYASQDVLWSIDNASKTYVYLPVENILNQQLVSNGTHHFSLSGSTIYSYDLDQLSVDVLVEIADIDVNEISIGTESSVFASGLRFSDLRDVVIEIDGETGEILNEWVSEEAPPQSSIVFLSRI